MISDSATGLLIKSAILLTAVLAVLAVLKRKPASTRHAVLLAAMIACAALPVIVTMAPKWAVPFLPEQRVAIQSDTLAERNVTAKANNSSGSSVPIALWIGVALLLGARQARSIGAIRYAGKRRPEFPDSEFKDRAERLLQDRDVQLLMGEPWEPPMTWGFRHPFVMLPSTATEWPESRLEAVIRHELAHVDRNDWLTQTVSRLVCSLYWFHPASWLFAWRLDLESERAADDRVICLGCDPQEYAEHLIAVAREVRMARAASAVALSRTSSVRYRVQAILSSRTPRRSISRPANTLLAGACGVLTVLIAGAGPKIVWLTASRKPESERATNIEHSIAADDSNAKPIAEATQHEHPIVLAKSNEGCCICLNDQPQVRYVSVEPVYDVQEAGLGSPLLRSIEPSILHYSSERVRPVSPVKPLKPVKTISTDDGPAGPTDVAETPPPGPAAPPPAGPETLVSDSHNVAAKVNSPGISANSDDENDSDAVENANEQAQDAEDQRKDAEAERKKIQQEARDQAQESREKARKQRWDDQMTSRTEGPGTEGLVTEDEVSDDAGDNSDTPATKPTDDATIQTAAFETCGPPEDSSQALLDEKNRMIQRIIARYEASSRQSGQAKEQSSLFNFANTGTKRPQSFLKNASWKSSEIRFDSAFPEDTPDTDSDDDGDH
jgi:beta-lactamase regulating signal transducer with metallopeptidase domain